MLWDTTNPLDPGPASVLSPSPRSALGARLSPGPAGRGPGLPSGAALCRRACPVTLGDSRVPTQRPRRGPHSGAHGRDAEAGLLSPQGLCPWPSLATDPPATFPGPPTGGHAGFQAPTERDGALSAPVSQTWGEEPITPWPMAGPGWQGSPDPWVSKQVANEKNTTPRSSEVRTLLALSCRGLGTLIPQTQQHTHLEGPAGLPSRFPWRWFKARVCDLAPPRPRPARASPRSCRICPTPDLGRGGTLPSCPGRSGALWSLPGPPLLASWGSALPRGPRPFNRLSRRIPPNRPAYKSRRRTAVNRPRSRGVVNGPFAVFTPIGGHDSLRRRRSTTTSAL